MVSPLEGAPPARVVQYTERLTSMLDDSRVGRKGDSSTRVERELDEMLYSRCQRCDLRFVRDVIGHWRATTTSSRDGSLALLATIAWMNDVSPPAGRICEIWTYPVKSMQGIQLDGARLDAAGIAGDRRLAVRDLVTGKILSAKAPSLGRALLACHARHHEDSDQVVVTVGGRDFLHLDHAADLADALSTLLGRPAALAHSGAEGEVYASEWPELDDMALSDVEMDLPMPSSSFADVAPIQLLTTASLARLATLAPGSDLDVNRFRPSMVIEVEGDGFVENGWVNQQVRIGDATLRFGPASPRCVMTTLAQPGLDEDRSVLRTLAAHNKLDYSGFGNFACLGVYADVTTAGTVHVGDEIVAI